MLELEHAAVMRAQPQPETAAKIKAALSRQRDASIALLDCSDNPDELVVAAGAYLDATDAVYASQVNVPRVFS